MPGLTSLISVVCSTVLPREVVAHVCYAGNTDPFSEYQNWSERLEDYWNRETPMFNGNIKYRFKVHVMDSVEECEAMREEQLRIGDDCEDKEWSPVFIWDMSDDTLFNRVRIGAMAFDNEQLHMRKVLNQGNQKGHVKWQSPLYIRDALREYFNRIDFDFRFDEWDSGITAKNVIDGFEHAIKDGSGNPKWDIHTGKDILSALKGDSQYFGIQSDVFNKAVDQAFQSNDLALSKSFYAFNKEKQSGVIFIGELHNHDRFIDMELSIIESLFAWLDTLFTEACVSELARGKPLLLSAIQMRLESERRSKLRICPLLDSSQCEQLAIQACKLPNMIRDGKVLCIRRFGAFTKQLNLSKPDFRNPETLEWDSTILQRSCIEDQIICTGLNRSMLMLNSLDLALEPGTLNIAIQGGRHTLDNYLAMKGELDQLCFHSKKA